ncbi:MAG: serine hydrolase [Phycisphaerae bacterium]
MRTRFQLLDRLGRFAAVAAVTACGVSAIAAPPPPSMRHGKSTAQTNDYFANELPNDYRCISISVTGPTNDPRYTFACVHDTDITWGDWDARIGMTAQQYQDRTVMLFNDFGMRPIAVSATGEFPNELYAATWADDNTPAANLMAVHRRTEGDFVTQHNSAVNQGLVLRWFSATGTGNNIRYAGIWTRNTEGYAYVADFEVAAEDVNDTVAGIWGAGRRPYQIVGYDDPPRFTILSVRPDGPNWDVQKIWDARVGLTSDQYQANVLALDDWMQPTAAIAYQDGGNTRYAVTWAQEKDPKVFTATGTAVPALSQLDAEMANYMIQRKVPNGALAVSKNGRLLYSRAFTYDQPGAPLAQPGSYFRIASVSKPLTAIAITQLIERGQLDPNDTLADFPELGVINWCDPLAAGITVRDLLQHTGGWNRDIGDPNDPNQTSICGGGTRNRFDPMFMDFAIRDELPATLPVSQLDIYQWAALHQLDFSPGTDYNYSNFGFSLLGRIIEAVSGQSYESFVRENVLCPVGAQGMRIGRGLQENRYSKEIGWYQDPFYRGATSRYDGETVVPNVYGGWNQENMDAHGSWIGTASQLVRVANAFWDKGNSPLLSEASIDWMDDPSAQSGGSYARGWQMWGDRVYHNGALTGTWAYMVRRPDGICWAVLLNSRLRPTENVPIAGQDGDILGDMDAAISAIEASGGMPTHNFFGAQQYADFNCDGSVNLPDLSRLLGKFGLDASDRLFDPDLDLDGDRVIGLSDLSIVLASFGAEVE